MVIDRIFLIVAAVGLLPIALSYGANPASVLSYLYGFSVENLNLVHIFRAVMGLYLALIVFWLAGAMVSELRVPALWSLVVFMLGLAAGRIFSLTMDGVPPWLLVVFLLLELAFGVVGLMILRSIPAYQR